MPIATPEIYADMLDRAKKGAFAYPAINVSSSQTITAAIRGFAEAESDGIIQFSWGGAEYASGSTVKNMVDGAVALAEFAHVVAKNYKVNIGIHTDHCPSPPQPARRRKPRRCQKNCSQRQMQPACTPAPRRPRTAAQT